MYFTLFMLLLFSFNIQNECNEDFASTQMRGIPVFLPFSFCRHATILCMHSWCGNLGQRQKLFACRHFMTWQTRGAGGKVKNVVKYFRRCDFSLKTHFQWCCREYGVRDMVFRLKSLFVDWLSSYWSKNWSAATAAFACWMANFHKQTKNPEIFQRISWIFATEPLSSVLIHSFVDPFSVQRDNREFEIAFIQFAEESSFVATIVRECINYEPQQQQIKSKYIVILSWHDQPILASSFACSVHKYEKRKHKISF